MERIDPMPWLHVVSGPRPFTLARGAFELSARLLAEGRRVLVIDGAPRLALHALFERGAARGLTQGLAADVPVLTLAQTTDRLGLYLLAHGAPQESPRWPSLGALLGGAAPHFGSVVLAIDPDAPPDAGEALTGRPLAAWWPHQGAGQGTCEALDRVAIGCHELDVEAMPTPTLEALDHRVWDLVAARRETRVGAHGLAPAPAPAEPLAAGAACEAPAAEPALEGDARVRERLRFMLWARRGEAEAAARAAAAEAGRDAASPAAESAPEARP
jgi:hypothetical protein